MLKTLIPYLFILMLLVIIARTLTPTKYKRHILLAGIALVVLAGVVVGLETGQVAFYVVTALPVFLILVSVFLRQSHKDKNLKKNIDF